MMPTKPHFRTLLYLLGLLIPPTSGRYRFRELEVDTLADRSRSQLRGKEIGFVFQSFHLVPQINVVDNVLLGARYLGDGNGTDWSGKAREYLDRVGLSHRLRHRPSPLSNGEMQRVAIARALMGSPSLLLADEPTGNLDEKTGKEVFDLITALNKEGTTVILVTHNMSLARKIKRRISLKDGQVTK